LSDQLFDLRVEATGLSSLNAEIQLVVSGNKHDALQGVGTPEVTTNNDNNAASLDKAWTWRRLSFGREGLRTLKAIITEGSNSYEASTQIGVQEFKLQGNKNIILFIGDAMGTAYRDASRIVAQSTGHRFREGFFDELQQMDQMPVTGMVMTYALDNITPDLRTLVRLGRQATKPSTERSTFFPTTTTLGTAALTPRRSRRRNSLPSITRVSRRYGST
jgi:hypothetical protein